MYIVFDEEFIFVWGFLRLLLLIIINTPRIYNYYNNNIIRLLHLYLSLFLTNLLFLLTYLNVLEWLTRSFNSFEFDIILQFRYLLREIYLLNDLDIHSYCIILLNSLSIKTHNFN
jgi:hypothetical protein